MRAVHPGLSILLLLAAIAAAEAGDGCRFLNFRPDASPRTVTAARNSRYWQVRPRAGGESPTRWWRRARFDGACEALERCFTSLESRREACEARFRADLEAACDSTYTGPYDQRARKRCGLSIELLMRSLEDHTPALYEDARYEARHLGIPPPDARGEGAPAGVRTSEKWGVEYAAPVLRVPTRWQRAGTRRDDATGEPRRIEGRVR